jgi:RNA polymerase sigma factor FliA
MTTPSSSTAARVQALVKAHTDYARALARKIHQQLPRHVSFEELCAYAMLGLTQAATEFDPSREAAFTTFAYYRVRGAVFDGISEMSGITPAMRRRIMAQEKHDEVLRNIADDLADDADRAQLAALADTAIQRTAMVFVASQIAPDDDRPIEPSTDDAPDEAAAESEMVTLLRTVLPRLDAESRELLEMNYVQGLSFAEIGKMLGKNRSTIMRRHDKALDELRAAMTPASSGSHTRIS